MWRSRWILCVVVWPVWLLAGVPTWADDDEVELSVRLRGFQEVPPISTAGRADFNADGDEDELDFTLRYAQLEGIVTAAHIHFAQAGVNGGIVIHLCGTGGRPSCPPSPGTVKGTIRPSDVVAVPGQGIDAGNLQEVLRAIAAGRAYVNVHSNLYPGGEVRGQIRSHGGHDGH